jgi:soluble lytic murein transglycosylase-like protein
VLKRSRVVPLVSASGDVGIMQVNRRVWRGFFDLQKLAWDIVYNAGAGCEILAQLLARYATREAGSSPDAAARATYSAYNAGPDAYRRWRSGNVPAAERAIDEAFWTKYRAMATGRVRDEVLCL